MLVHICDKCHDTIKGARFDLGVFKMVLDGDVRYELRDKEFCSLYCKQQYIINGMKGRGLDTHIKI